MMIDLVKLHRSISIGFLRYYTKFWIVDADVPRSELESWPTPEAANQSGKVVPWKRRKTRIWPRVILGIMIVNNFKLLLTSFYHFRYDCEYIKLIRMANMTDEALVVRPATVVYGPDSPEYLEQAARVEAAKRTLKLVGDFTSNLHWSSTLMMVLSVCGCLYSIIALQLMVSLRLIAPHDYYFLRIMLDETRELQDWRLMVSEMVRQFKDSSRNFYLNWAYRVERTLQLVESKRATANQSVSRSGDLNRIRLGRLPRKSALIRQAKLQVYLSERADQLAQSGQLMPLNRMPEMVNEMSARFAFAITSLWLITATFFVYFTIVVPFQSGMVDVSNFMDFWMLVDYLSKLVTDCSFAVVLTSLYSTIWPNQLDYMNVIISKLRCCREENLKQFISHRQRNQSLNDTERLSMLINGNLSKVLLEYGVFAKQFAPTKRSFAVMVSVMPIMLLTDYFILRLTMPYAGQTMIQLGVTARSFVIGAMIDSTLVPLCQMNQRGEKLYSEMASLLAHSIELDLEMLELEGRHIYSAHLVWLQRKLVCGPEKFMEQFCGQAYDDNFTMCWPNLVQIHYFVSMLLLSSYFKIKSWENIFGNRLNDPLNLFAD